MNIGKLQHKQNCADRLQSIVQGQVICARKIKEHKYIPTPALKGEMERLIAEYDIARDAYDKACLECDIPVYVTPIA